MKALALIAVALINVALWLLWAWFVLWAVCRWVIPAVRAAWGAP